MNDREVYAAYVNAAIALATSVDVRDRIDTDPSYGADRGRAAQASRDEIRKSDLERFRAAKDAFLAAVTS